MFSNPEIVRQLQTAFVPYAGDRWYLNRQQDADGTFVRKLGRQRGLNADGSAPQGIYIAAPDGTLLAADHFHPAPERMQALLNKGRQGWEARPQSEVRVAGDAPASPAADPAFARRPPPSGLILNVFSRIPLPPPPGQTWTPNQATGRDHLWLTAEDARALLPPAWKNGTRYLVPPAVAERLLRFHLVDNVRGEPNFWRREHIQKSDLTLVVEDGAAGRVRLTGTARLESDVNHGYQARLQGNLVYDRARNHWTRLDLLAWGDAWGEGTYTRGAPEGRFPLVIAASLAGKSGADRVPPQASRDLREYLGTGSAAR